jgi:hypothetical protein
MLSNDCMRIVLYVGAFLSSYTSFHFLVCLSLVKSALEAFLLVHLQTFQDEKDGEGLPFPVLEFELVK